MNETIAWLVIPVIIILLIALAVIFAWKSGVADALRHPDHYTTIPTPAPVDQLQQLGATVQELGTRGPCHFARVTLQGRSTYIMYWLAADSQMVAVPLNSPP